MHYSLQMQLKIVNLLDVCPGLVSGSVYVTPGDNSNQSVQPSQQSTPRLHRSSLRSKRQELETNNNVHHVW